MSWSIGEIGALTVKAARGSGLSWGEAEEFGWAVRWLARSGLPGVEAAAACLSVPDRACPVALGLSVADWGMLERLKPPRPVLCPMLVLPFLSRLVGAHDAIRVSINAVRCTVTGMGAVCDGPLPAEGVVRSLGRVAPPVGASLWTRVLAIDPAALGALEALAALTYAPATETSRLLGAGGADDPSD